MTTTSMLASGRRLPVPNGLLIIDDAATLQNVTDPMVATCPTPAVHFHAPAADTKQPMAAGSPADTKPRVAIGRDSNFYAMPLMINNRQVKEHNNAIQNRWPK